MDDRKRRRSTENADDIESILLSKKQVLVNVNTSFERPSSAPIFSNDGTNSTKLPSDNLETISSTSLNTASRDFIINTGDDSISMSSNFDESNIYPTDSSVETKLSHSQPTIRDQSLEEEDPTTRQRVDTYKMALERIEDLQQSLYDDSSMESDDDFDLKDHLESLFGPDAGDGAPRIDPQTLGFLMCAQETMKYLFEHGIQKDNPIVISLRDRLIQGIQQI